MRQHRTTLMLIATMLAGIPLTSNAQETITQFKVELRMYQVTTRITGNGLTSQTLPGINGLLHVIHEKLGETELVMDGKQLTWNGADAPSDKNISISANPVVITIENKKASIEIVKDGPVQYFARTPDGHFELQALNDEDPRNKLGIVIGLTPRRVEGKPDELNCDFSFHSSWIKGREPLEGVGLDVGKPILETVTAEGPLGARLGEWVCYRTIAEGQGAIYLFMKITLPEQ
ncbi:MAG: hypothetical protein HY706_10605 [Candidatus Hydrogenedentes bacterium]|nr:hypothetical protein [Candidatus Hydrogenedentota bacterium]